MNIPETLRCGDTWTWTDSVSNYPATSYTLKYTIYRLGYVITATAAASGANYVVTVAAATTAAYSPGAYSWEATVEKGSGGTLERYSVGSGTVTIKPNLAAALSTTDNRTYWEKVLDAANAALLEYAAKGVASISVNGKAITYKRETEILAMRDRAQREVNKERGTSRIVRAQFGSY